MPNFRGKLKRMDNKSITLTLGDYRELEFRRNDKTRFFKNGDEIKSPKFNVGDQISVEGPEDPDGSLTAVNVYWEKAGSPESAKSGKNDDVVDTWAKDEPAKDTKGAKDTKNPAKDDAKDASGNPIATAPEASAEKAPPPSRPDPDDPGPPRLTRGKVADARRERAAEPPAEVAAAAPAPHVTENPPVQPAAPPSPPVVRRSADEDTIPMARRHDDPLVRKASDAALDFTETLPSYVCQEMMSRYQSSSHPADWQPIDVITTNLVYDNGKEDYRDIAVNGKPIKKRMEEMSGAWSTGEFGTVLIDLFSPATAADFHFRKDSRASGVDAKVYDFDVSREHSHWNVHIGAQTYRPAYRGSVWIDPQTARVLRIEMQAYGFPEEFPTDHVESATDYQYVRLGDLRQYLLPVHAETLTCQRGSNNCSRNSIDFRNYHKYTGESEITFGSIKPDPAEQAKPPATKKK